MFSFPIDPPIQQELPFAIHEKATPHSTKPFDPQQTNMSGMFPEQHYPIQPYYHSPSPNPNIAVDPYNQSVQNADLILQELSKDGNQPYSILSPSQNALMKMEPLSSNGDSARGQTFSMNWDELEKYRKREYTVEIPTISPSAQNLSYIQTTDRYYPSPGFFLQSDPSYYTYPQVQNYYGTAPITSISFGAVNPQRFFWNQQQQKEEKAKIEKTFSSPNAPNAFLESFQNLQEMNHSNSNEDVSFSTMNGIFVFFVLLILLCLWHIYSK
jgi:hypothetical protein